jgi:hypothetical protein
MSKLERIKKQDDYETRWCVVGPAGAVDFHCTNEPVKGWSERVGGLEEHRRAPAYYQNAESPSHEHCSLLNGKCWHDGSSLYASEFIIPFYEQSGEEALWPLLEGEYRRRFEEPAE